jgi:DNA topoisomerase VI subunit B
MKSADELATKQREISIAEFFEKNRHLLGFDNRRKALLTTIKEAVDNSLDACEEARILPDINVEINQLSEFKYNVIVEDNGPGIVKAQLPKVFAKLLYGSKFFKLSQSLAGDEPVIVRIDGRVQIMPIGELVDTYLKEEGEAPVANVEVPAFDWKEYKYAFSKAASVIKHKREHDIYRIGTRYGRNIKVTGCHSLFTLGKDLKVHEVEAKDLKKGACIVAPRSLPHEGNQKEVNILKYLSAEEAGRSRWYVYGVRPEFIEAIIKKAEVVEKVLTKRKRRFYRLMDCEGQAFDILEESVKNNYMRKEFLPLWIILRLGLEDDVKDCALRSYYHGKETNVPVIWPVTRAFMRFLGLFVAEGHTDQRQIGFTFGIHEPHLAEEMKAYARNLGFMSTTELRSEKNSIRVKVFTGVLSTLMKEWCGKGAKNKGIPSFVFEYSKERRQEFIDALYEGDGHNTVSTNQLMHSTVSRNLALQLNYLWLMNGVVASTKSVEKIGLGTTPSTAYVTTVYGKGIESSIQFKPPMNMMLNSHSFIPQSLVQEFIPQGEKAVNPSLFSFLRTAKLGVSEKQRLHHLEVLQNMAPGEEYSREEVRHVSLEEINGHTIHDLLNKGYMVETTSGIMLTAKTQQLLTVLKQLEVLQAADICLLEVTEVERITEGYEYVYDISVPGKENFVASGLSCHNSRGQQGIGISAAVLYSQLTTGRPAKIISRISAKQPAQYYELHIDVKKNAPEIVKEEEIEWNKEHGTRIELTLEADYLKGPQSVDEYIRQTAIINPHVSLTYTTPKGEQLIYGRATDTLPPLPREIQPHPYGVEIGLLMRMLDSSPSRTLQSFLTSEFSRVGPGTAKEICQNATVLPDTKPSQITREQAEKLIEGISKTKIIAPPTDCISPIGEELMEKGLRKEVEAEFYCATSRPPSVYRGNPFIVEAAIAYGGKIPAEKSVSLLRFANRVPLLYQQGACATTESVTDISWKPYGLQQSGSSVPSGPAIVIIHMASVWVPFTSEAKEAIAHYPEILKDVKLALQECGRKLGMYVNKKVRANQQLERANLFDNYIPEIADSLAYLSSANKDKLITDLKNMLNKEEIQAQLHAGNTQSEEQDE